MRRFWRFEDQARVFLWWFVCVVFKVFGLFDDDNTGVITLRFVRSLMSFFNKQQCFPLCLFSLSLSTHIQELEAGGQRTRWKPNRRRTARDDRWSRSGWRWRYFPRRVLQSDEEKGKPSGWAGLWRWILRGEGGREKKEGRKNAIETTQSKRWIMQTWKA